MRLPSIFALLKDLTDRIARATAFANTDNLGDALDLMRERHQDEVAMRQSDTVRQAAYRTMNRPLSATRGRDVPSLQDRREVRSEARGKFLAVN